MPIEATNTPDDGNLQDSKKVVSLPVMPAPRGRDRLLSDLAYVNTNILIAQAVLDDLLKRRININTELLALKQFEQGGAR